MYDACRLSGDRRAVGGSEKFSGGSPVSGMGDHQNGRGEVEDSAQRLPQRLRVEDGKALVGNLSPLQQTVGAGALDGAARRGLFLHPLHGFTPDDTTLGTLHATVWTRDDEPPLPRNANTR